LALPGLSSWTDGKPQRRVKKQGPTMLHCGTQCTTRASPASRRLSSKYFRKTYLNSHHGKRNNCKYSFHPISYLSIRMRSFFHNPWMVPLRFSCCFTLFRSDFPFSTFNAGERKRLFKPTLCGNALLSAKSASERQCPPLAPFRDSPPRPPAHPFQRAPRQHTP